MIEARRKIERIALQEQVHEVLKERILDRAYAADEKLNIDALTRELKVSSTPIREALGRLAAEGLVKFEPFVGYAVAPMPTRAYFEQLFDFRLLIESWAAGRTADLRPASVIAELHASVAAMAEGRLARNYLRYRGFSEADDAFHVAIIAGTGNEPARKSYQDLRVHLHLSRLYINREQDTDAAHRQHLAVLEAIEAGDCKEAAERMREHLLMSKARLLDEPAQQPTTSGEIT